MVWLALSGVASGVVLAVVAAWLAAVIGLDSQRRPSVVAVLVLCGLSGDILQHRFGHPRPPHLRRQVSRSWGHGRRLEHVALNYGWQLGVGPLTILSSWSWWTASAIGAMSGVAPAIAVACTFAVARVATMVLVTIGIGDGAAMSRRMERVQSSRRRVTNLCGAMALALAAGVLFA